MSGTPEKILEHLLETIKLDSNGNDAIGEHLVFFVYLITHGCCFNHVFAVSMFVSLQIPVRVTFCSPTKFSCPPVSCVPHYSTNILWQFKQRSSLIAVIKLYSAESFFFFSFVNHFYFMPFNHHCTYQAELSKGTDQEKASYILTAKQKVVKLIGQWVALYGLLLKEDPVAVDFLEVNLRAWFEHILPALFIYFLLRM